MRIEYYTIIKNHIFQEFPGGPGVETWCFHSRPQILSLSRKLDPTSPTVQPKAKHVFLVNSLAVQWLRLPSNAKVLGSIPDQGNKILQTVWHGKKKKKPCLLKIFNNSENH